MIPFASRIVFLPGAGAILICIISYIYSSGDNKTTDTSTDPLIFVGVISARDNSDYRRDVRETWGKWTDEPIFDLKFFIGQQCHIPPDDRGFEQNCAQTVWPHGDNYQGVFWSNTFVPNPSLSAQPFKGFSFLINHPVIVKSVRLANWAQTMKKTTVKMLNAHTREQLDILEFPQFAEDEYELATQTYLLPRGFEGILSVEEVDEDMILPACHKWSDHGRLVEFTWLIGNDDLTEPVGTPDACVPVALSFVFSDIKSFLEERPVRLQNWNYHLTNISSGLIDESGEHSDLLFVETVDVYRNLASKMLDVYNWVANNRKYSFLLKVDDDTFVDLVRIGNHVKLIAAETKHEIWWWGDLKVRWAVPRFGKWRDDVHLSISYPPFPCGAAYLLSPPFVNFLGTNSPVLTKYPFEDTAVGLWADSADLSPMIGQSTECKMSCESPPSNCNVSLCFVLQNKPGDMHHLMSTYDENGYLC